MRHLSSRSLSAQLKTSTSAAAQAVASATAGLPAATTTFTAGEAVQKGDLIVQAGDQLAYWANDPNVTGAATRPLALSADLLQGNLVAPVSAAAGTNPRGPATQCVLNSGNIVVAQVATAGTNIGYPVFAIYTPLGVLVTGPIKINIAANTTSGARITLAPLSDGGFAVGVAHYNTGAPGVAKFDANGVAVGAVVALEAANVFAYGTYVTPTANGGFAVAWYTVASYAAKLAFFDATCTQQGAAITIGNNAGGSNGPTVNSYGEVMRAVTLNNGNIAVVWFSSNNTVNSMTVRRAIYSPTGAVVAADAATGIVGGYASSGWWGALSVFLLTDGGVGIVTTIGQRVYVCKFTSTGAAVGAVADVSGADIVNFPMSRGCAIPGGGIFYSFANNTSATTGLTAWGVYNADMSVNVPYTTMNINGTTNNGYCWTFPFLMPNGDVTVLADYAATTMYGVRFGLVGNTWAQRDNGAALSGVTYTASNYNQITGSSTPGASYPLALPLTDAASAAGLGYALLPQLSTSATAITLQLVNAVVQKRSLVGVAQAAAIKGAAVVVQVLGAIPTRLTFAKPVLIDQTGAAMPGQKASLIGNVAILKGIQP